MQTASAATYTRIVDDNTLDSSGFMQNAVVFLSGSASIIVATLALEYWGVDMMFLAVLLLIFVAWRLIGEIPRFVISRHPQRLRSMPILELMGMVGNFIQLLIFSFVLVVLQQLFANPSAVNRIEGVLLVLVFILSVLFVALNLRISQTMKQQQATKRLKKLKLQEQRRATELMIVRTA